MKVLKRFKEVLIVRTVTIWRFLIYQRSWVIGTSAVNRFFGFILEIPDVIITLIVARKEEKKLSSSFNPGRKI